MRFGLEFGKFKTISGALGAHHAPSPPKARLGVFGGGNQLHAFWNEHVPLIFEDQIINSPFADVLVNSITLSSCKSEIDRWLGTVEYPQIRVHGWQFWKVIRASAMGIWSGGPCKTTFLLSVEVSFLSESILILHPVSSCKPHNQLLLIRKILFHDLFDRILPRSSPQNWRLRYNESFSRRISWSQNLRWRNTNARILFYGQMR